MDFHVKQAAEVECGGLVEGELNLHIASEFARFAGFISEDISVLRVYSKFSLATEG